ncbi:MAG: tetratricopeptide repeat protein [Rubripirellula sp.]
MRQVLNPKPKMPSGPAVQRLALTVVAGVVLSVASCGKRSSEPSPELFESRDERALPVVEQPNTENSVPSPEVRSSVAPPPDEVPSAANPMQLQEEAIAALERGDLATAFEQIREAQRLNPADPQTTFVMARVLAGKNRFREAIRMLDGLAAVVPDARLPVMGQTAEWLVMQGDWQQAEQRYRDLRGMIGETGLVDRLLSRLLIRQGRQVEAESLLRNLVQAGNVEEMDLRSLLTLAYPFAGDAVTEPFEPIGVEGNVRHEMSLDRWDEAEALLRDRKLTPNESALLGRVLARQQDFDALAEWVEEAQSTAAPTSDYWYGLAAHQAKTGSHAAAVQSWAQVVLKDPTDANAYKLLSESLQEMGSEVEAKLAADRAALVEETQRMGNKMALSNQRDIQEITTLINLLEQLERPFESLGWRGVQVAYGRSNAMLTEEAARDVLVQINQRRQEQIKNQDADATQKFVLCGVELGDPSEPGDDERPEDQSKGEPAATDGADIEGAVPIGQAE